MRELRVRNGRTGATVGATVALADSWWRRLRGLMGRPPLRPGEGLLLVPCRGVHMLGMRYPIDVAVLNRGGSVIAIHPGLAPGRRTPLHRDGYAVLEVPAGTIAATGTAVGDPLEWEEQRSPRSGEAAA